MKAVLIGTDYIKTESGEYKILEINTNTRIDTSNMDLLNWDNLTNFISGNSFTEVVVICPTYTKNFADKLKDICENNLNITFNSYETSLNSITVPYVEDSESKLIIRVSYDTTAIVDDEYARDSYSLIRALGQSVNKPKTYVPNISDDFSDLTEFTYTGSAPNFIIKQRLPNYDKQTWPKLYKVSNLSELNNLKTLVEENTQYLQEFHLSELSSNKRNIVRGIDIIYGSNLDIINLGGYKIEHSISETVWVNSYDENGKLENKDRPKYITYYNGSDNKWTYIYDEDQEVLMADGTKKTFANLQIDDLVKSIEVSQLPMDETTYTTETWVGSHTEFMADFAVSNTAVMVKTASSPLNELFIRITLDNEITWDDLPATDLLTRNDDVIRFKKVNFLEVGDVLELFSTETQSVVNKTVTSLEIVFKNNEVVGTVDVEPRDLFLPLISNSLTLIQHNACNTSFCGPLGVPQCYIYPKCSNCTNAQCGK